MSIYRKNGGYLVLTHIRRYLAGRLTSEQLARFLELCVESEETYTANELLINARLDNKDSIKRTYKQLILGKVKI